jgi:hypothetical protein
MTIASPQFRIVFICCLDGVQVCLWRWRLCI